MSGADDVVRVEPGGPITRPEVGIPVLATLHWVDGRETDVPAIATAWTTHAVEVRWLLDARDVVTVAGWIPAGDVRRGQAATERMRKWQGAHPHRPGQPRHTG